MHTHTYTDYFSVLKNKVNPNELSGCHAKIHDKRNKKKNPKPITHSETMALNHCLDWWPCRRATAFEHIKYTVLRRTTPFLFYRYRNSNWLCWAIFTSNILKYTWWLLTGWIGRYIKCTHRTNNDDADDDGLAQSMLTQTTTMMMTTTVSNPFGKFPVE